MRTLLSSAITGSVFSNVMTLERRVFRENYGCRRVFGPWQSIIRGDGSDWTAAVGLTSSYASLWHRLVSVHGSIPRNYRYGLGTSRAASTTDQSPER